MARWLCYIVLLTIAAASGSNAQERSEALEKAAPHTAVVKTAVLEAAAMAQKLDGIASILSPDALIQLNADIRAAGVAATFSRRESERYKTSNSLSPHVVQSAERQAEIDATQLALLELRLKQLWGEDSPFAKPEARQNLIEDLSAGRTVLVRLDFPQSQSEQPKNIRVIPLSGGTETPVTSLWTAPTGNSAMPGISYFGLLAAGPGLRHLDRARVVADSGAAKSGVIIPNSALVVFAGETWCYIESEAQKFERKKVPLTWPVETGYLVQDGFAPGTKVVIRGASTLLAREAAPEEDDEVSGAHKSETKANSEDKEKAKDHEPQADTTQFKDRKDNKDKAHTSDATGTSSAEKGKEIGKDDDQDETKPAASAKPAPAH